MKLSAKTLHYLYTILNNAANRIKKKVAMKISFVFGKIIIFKISL